MQKDSIEFEKVLGMLVECLEVLRRVAEYMKHVEVAQKVYDHRV